jgi:hypothetical protein
VKLHFNYSIDCELPPNTPYTGGTERQPFFHGPSTWAFAEASVCGFVEQMDSLGLRRGASLFVYPDVARHQAALYRAMAEAGIEVALHLNALRYSRLSGERAKWLGAMGRDEQLDALRMAKDEVEQVTGRACLGYRACYGSANDDTFPILEELGFTWSSNASNRHRPEFVANWRGSWPYPHHPHAKCKLVVGDLRIYEMPVTVGLAVMFDETLRQPLDLRVETPPQILGGRREKLREVVLENLDEMAMREVPVRGVFGASHNTSPYNDRDTHPAQNLDWVARHTRESAAERSLEFVAASFADVSAEAERVGAY